MILNNTEFTIMNSPIRRIIQKEIEFKRMLLLESGCKSENVLELGCGSGYGTQLINNHLKPKHLIAVDLDEKMIKIANKNSHPSNITYKVADGIRLPFNNNSFDVIFEFGVIHHIPDWKICLDEAFRVLKPGGCVVAEELSIESFEGILGRLFKKTLDHPYDSMFNMSQFMEYLTKAGFSSVKQRTYANFGLLPYFTFVAYKPI